MREPRGGARNLACESLLPDRSYAAARGGGFSFRPGVEVAAGPGRALRTTRVVIALAVFPSGAGGLPRYLHDALGGGRVAGGSPSRCGPGNQGLIVEWDP